MATARSRTDQSPRAAGPILVTGAAGKTGLAVIGRLLATPAAPAAVRALVRSTEHRAALERIGLSEVIAGDLRDPAAVAAALAGARSVYHICPNVHPDETEIGWRMIELAVEAGVEHFVFHSVLHPQTRLMPHHWAKLLVEERLFESGLDFTIVQPAPYMQNVLAQWPAIAERGVYPIPYAPSTRIAMVDLEDVAEVAARVLTEADHEGSVYELAGADLLDQTEVAAVLAAELDRTVSIDTVDRSHWAEAARTGGLGDYQVATLLAMFRYYERFGMAGNPTVLERLLGRPPATFADFVGRTIQGVGA